MNKLNKKKVLFTSHTANFSKFNRPFMRWFKENGYEVHYASAGEEEVEDCDKHFPVCFNRSPYSLDNITAYRQLKRIIDKENYGLIHCHTPMGSVVTRLAARAARKKGTKVIYTAHGFHFFTSAPLSNWLLYYPIEKILSKDIDALVTINNEDYNRAKAKFYNKITYKIDGVGVSLDRFRPVSGAEKQLLRKEYGYTKKDKILICVAEFTVNKNQKFILESISKISESIPDIKVIFAGDGYRFDYCKELADKLGVGGRANFMGYRQDVERLYAISDVLVSSSSREGFGINIVEGMAMGLPAVCTRIRGHSDIVEDKRNGLFYNPGDSGAFEKAVIGLLKNNQLYSLISKNNIEDSKKYSLDKAIKNMSNIYKKFL